VEDNEIGSDPLLDEVAVQVGNTKGDLHLYIYIRLSHRDDVWLFSGHRDDCPFRPHKARSTRTGEIGMMLRWANKVGFTTLLGRRGFCITVLGRRGFCTTVIRKGVFVHSGALFNLKPFWATEFTTAGQLGCASLHRTYMQPFSERLRQVVETMEKMG